MTTPQFKVLRIAAWGLLSCLIGCGTSDQRGSDGTDGIVGPYQCPAEFSACGGSLVGTWRWDETCIAFDASCFDLAVVDGEERTDTFSADGAFAGTAAVDSVTDTTTAACYAPGGPNSGTPCSGSASDVCAFDVSGNCTCTGGTTYTATSGSYTSTGSTFTLNLGDGSPDRTFDYCVRNSELITHSAAGHILFYTAL
jgi:hypothetical protein